MNKFQIFAGKALILYFRSSHFITASLKKVFGTKTILLVSKQKIKSYSLTPLTQIAFLFLVFCIGSIFIRSLKYNLNVRGSYSEISDLRKANQLFGDEVESLNANLQKINVYFKSISGYKNSEINQGFDQKNIDKKSKGLFGKIKLDSQSQEIASKIADSNLILDDIKLVAAKRINDLEQKLSIAGIALSGNKAVLRNNAYASNENQNVISLNNKDDLRKKQGGPFKKFITHLTLYTNSPASSFNTSQFNIKNEIEYLANLEKFVHFAPLSAPMKNYYVSSVFGERTDPIKGIPSRHSGMDFAGHEGAKIISPSAGKVIFAGKFSSYGNMVIIDHGYGLTTRYGHLSKIYVAEGSIIKKEQVIAAQGSSGRSTGPHLHYEVRYNNLPLNPKKFLKAGQEIFNS